MEGFDSFTVGFLFLGSSHFTLGLVQAVCDCNFVYTAIKLSLQLCKPIFCKYRNLMLALWRNNDEIDFRVNLLLW